MDSGSYICVKLCNLIKAQLVLAHAEVSRRFGFGKLSFNDAQQQQSSSPTKRAKRDESEENNEKDDSCVLPEPTDSSFEIPPPVYKDGEGFCIEETAPDSHKFKLTMFQPTDRSVHEPKSCIIEFTRSIMKYKIEKSFKMLKFSKKYTAIDLRCF